ncbi:DUF4357 domain-containing protein [Afifella sp. IM 167]|uniref:DUF4357 domain-containing protein n=1 Tax=Afifella sp. IM 167 TaxID=2033586 RepID=UPI001CCE1068|nr:DUF4357 domain-containing protein [Afifella sp. IM 167]MBZ8134385.1 hypothetical protein [Afifella sp. IM 167]
MSDWFLLERKAARATGYPVSLSGKHFVVREGSTALKVGGHRKARNHRLRDALVRRRVLEEHPSDTTLYVFASDFIFDNPSAAGDIVNGANESGPETWKHSGSGLSLKEWLPSVRAALAASAILP